NGGADQVVPSTWLQTGVRPFAQTQGLTGHYYLDDGSHNLDAAAKTSFLTRTDPLLSFDWGGGSPIPGGPTDHFMGRWSGYLTAPTSGSYTFGAASDDGIRITIGTSNTRVYDSWSDHGAADGYGTPITLTAGQTVPTTVDYYEDGGGASLFLKVIAPGDASGQ